LSFTSFAACAWHKPFYRLPELRKRVIYLDQFVISNLMKLDNPGVKGHERIVAEPFWRELRDLLFQLRQLRTICCSDSGLNGQGSRIAIQPRAKEDLRGIVGGITFKAFNSI